MNMKLNSATELFDFAYIPNLDNQLAKLAKMAKPELWNNPQNGCYGNLTILNYHLHHYFQRISEQNLIRYNRPSNPTAAWYNSGLETSCGLSIYLFFLPNRNPNVQTWTLAHILLESDLRRNGMEKSPKASFFTYEEERIFQTSFDIETRDSHILDERYYRFPGFQNLSRQERGIRFHNALENTRETLKAGEAQAAHQYYKGRIQYLLPLFLTGNMERADLVLPVGISGKKGYHAFTVLETDWAYKRARVLGPLPVSWLKL